MAGNGAPGAMNYRKETQLFFSIQVNRYLASRPQNRFSGAAEHDAVMEMIKDAWVCLRSSGELENVSAVGRRALYSTYLIVFPTFVASVEENVIAVDFGSARLLSHNRGKGSTQKL